MKRPTKTKSVCSIHGAAQAIQSFTLTCSECQNIVDGLLPESPATTSMFKLLERRSADLDFKLNPSKIGQFSDDDIFKKPRNLKNGHNHHKIKQKEENHEKQMKHVHDLINIIFKSLYDYSTEEYDQLRSNLMKSIISDLQFKTTDPQLVSSPRSSGVANVIHLECDQCLQKLPPSGTSQLPLTKKKLKFCRKGFIDIEEEVSLQKEVLNFTPWFPQLRMTYPNIENINHNVRVLNMLKKKLADLSYEKSDKISFPIDYSKLGVEGVFNPCYNYEINCAFNDPYVHYLAELKEMRRKPLKTIVIGKPGLALYNLAAEIANTCCNNLITPLTVMKDQSERMKEIHKRFSKQLSKGKRIEACDLFQIFYLIMDKLESKEVSLKGYTLAGIPFLRCDLPAAEQLSMIFGSHGVPATWRPDVIVYAVCPSEDIIPVMETYMLEPKRDLVMNMKSLETGEILVMEEKDSEQEFDQSSKAMFTQLQEERGVSYLLELYIEKPYHIMEEVDVYTQVVLPTLDVYIMEWDPQYLIRVDGRTPVLTMLEVVKSKLSTLGFSKTTSPYPLFVIKDTKVINDFKTIFSEYNLNIPLNEDNLNNIKTMNPSSVIPVTGSFTTNDQDDNSTLNKFQQPTTASGRLNESRTKTETSTYSLNKEKFNIHPEISFRHQSELVNEIPMQVSKESVYKIMLNMSKGNISFDLLNNLDDEELLACLKISKPQVENTRLAQSTLGTLCPVKLHEGYFVKGKAEWSVVYFGTIYLLSSEESQKKFLIDPKKFLDPHPLSKIYTFVYGNPNNIFGNEKYVDYLASELNVKVLDFQVLHEILLFHTIEPQLRKYIKKWKDDKVAKLNREQMKNIEKEKIEYVKDVKTWQKSIIDLVADYLETVEKLSQICNIDDIVPQSLLQLNKHEWKENTCRENMKQNPRLLSQQEYNYDETELPYITTSFVGMEEVLEDYTIKNSFVEEQSNKIKMLVNSESKADNEGSQSSTVSKKVTVHRAHGLIHMGKQVEDYQKVIKKSHYSDLTRPNNRKHASISSVESDLSFGRRNNNGTTGKVKGNSSSTNEMFIKELSVDHKKHTGTKQIKKKTDFTPIMEKRNDASVLLLEMPSAMRNKELENRSSSLFNFTSRVPYWSTDYHKYSSIPIFQCIRQEQQAVELERKISAAKRLKKGFYPHIREVPVPGLSDDITVGSIINQRYSSKFIKDTSGFSLSTSEESKIERLVESYCGKLEITELSDELPCIREETSLFPILDKSQHLCTSNSSSSKAPTDGSNLATKEFERKALMDQNSYRTLSENSTFIPKLYFLERYIGHPSTITKSPRFSALDQTFNDLRKRLRTSPPETDLRPTRIITKNRTSTTKPQAVKEELIIPKISLTDKEIELPKTSKTSSSIQLSSKSFQDQQISQDASHCQLKVTGEGIDIGYDMMASAPKDLSLYRARRIISAMGKRIFKKVSHYLDKEIDHQISTGTQTMDQTALLQQNEIQPIKKSPWFTNEVLKECKKTGVIRQHAPLLNYRFPPNCAYWKKMNDSSVISESKPILFSPVKSPGFPRSSKPHRKTCKLHSSSNNLVETLSNSDVFKAYNGLGFSEGNVETQRVKEFNETTGKSYIASSFKLKYHQIPNRDDRNPKPLGQYFERGVQCSKELLTSNPAVIRKSNQERDSLLNEDLKKWAALLLSEAADEKYYNKVQNKLVQKLFETSSKWNLRKIINFVESTDDATTQTEATTRNEGQEMLIEQDISQEVHESNSFRSCFSEEEIVDVLRISSAMVPPYCVTGSLLTNPEREEIPMRSDMMVYNWLNWEQPDATSLRFKRKGEWYSFQSYQDEHDFLYFLNSPLCPKDYRKWQSERFKKEVEIRKKFAFERRAKFNFNKVCDAMLKHYITMRNVRSINNDPLKKKTFIEEPYQLTRPEAVMIQKRNMIWNKLHRKEKNDVSKKQILSLIQQNTNNKTLNLIPNSEQLTSIKHEEVLELLKDIYFEKNQEELCEHVKLQCNSDDIKYLFDTNLQRRKNKPEKSVDKNYITLTKLDETESNQSSVVADCKEGVTQVNFYEEEFNRDLYTESLEEVADLLFKLNCESVLPQLNERKKPVKLKTQIRLMPHHKPGFELKTSSSDLLLPPNFLIMPFELMHTSRKMKKEWWRYLLRRIVQEWENITQTKCFYSMKVLHSNKLFDDISLPPSNGKPTTSKDENLRYLEEDSESFPEQLLNCVEGSDFFEVNSGFDPSEEFSNLTSNIESEIMNLNLIDLSIQNTSFDTGSDSQRSSYNRSSVSSLKNMALSILNSVLKQIGRKDFSISSFKSVPSEVLSLGTIMSLIEHLKKGNFRSEKSTKFVSDKGAMIKFNDKEVEKINNIVDTITKSLIFGEVRHNKSNNLHSGKEKNNLGEKVALFNHNNTLDNRTTKDAFISYYAEETETINQIVDLIHGSFSEDEEIKENNSLCHSNINTADFFKGYEINKSQNVINNLNLDKMKHCLTKLTVDANEAYLKNLCEFSCSTMENASDTICTKKFSEEKNGHEDKKRIKEIISLTDDLLFKCSMKQNPSLMEEKQILLDFKAKTYAVTQDDLLSFSEDTSSSLQSDGTSSYGSSNNNATGQVLLTSTDIYNKVKSIIAEQKFQLDDYGISKNEDCFHKNEQGSLIGQNVLFNEERVTPTVKSLVYYDEKKTKEIRTHISNLFEKIHLYNQKEERKSSVVSTRDCGRLTQEIANLAVFILESLNALKLGMKQTDSFDSLINEDHILEIENHVDIILDISEECNKELPRRSTVFFSEEQARIILEHADAILKTLILSNIEDFSDKERTSFRIEKTQNIRRHTETIVQTLSSEIDRFPNEDLIYLNEEQYLHVKESLDKIKDNFDVNGCTVIGVGVQTEVLRKSLIRILQALSPIKEDTTIKAAVVYSQKEAQEIRDHIYNLLQILSEDEETPQRKNAICYSAEEAHEIKNLVIDIFKTCKMKNPDHKAAFMLGTKNYNKIMCLLKYNRHTFDLDEIKQNNAEFIEDVSDCSSLSDGSKNVVSRSESMSSNNQNKSSNVVSRSESMSSNNQNKSLNVVSRSESMSSNNQNKSSEMLSTSFLATSLDEFQLFCCELLEKLDDSSTSSDSTSLFSVSTESIRKPCLKNIDKESVMSLSRFNSHYLSKETKKKLESVLLAISSSFKSNGRHASLNKFNALKKELDYFLYRSGQDKKKLSSISSNGIEKDNHKSISQNNLIHKKESSKSSNTISDSNFKEDCKNNALDLIDGSYKSSLTEIEWEELKRLLESIILIEERILSSIECSSIKSSEDEKLIKYEGFAKRIDRYIKLLEDKKEKILDESLIVADNISHESETSKCLKHYIELKKRFEHFGMLHFCYDNNRSFRKVLSNPDELLGYLPVSLLVRIPAKKHEIYDENHPLVVEGVKKKFLQFLNKLESSDWELSDMYLGKVLSNVLKYLKNESNSFGWILLNAPAQKSIWEYLESKNLTPNNIIYSQDLKLPNYFTKLFCSCGQVSCSSAFYEVMQNNQSKDICPLYSDEEKKVFANLIRTKVMKKMNNYSKDWACLKKLLMNSSCKTKLSRIDVDIKESEVFVKKVLGNISSLKHGRAHAYTDLDRVVYEPLDDLHPILSEYAKDYFKVKSKNRIKKKASMVDNIYGDTYPYCPVALLKCGVFIDGNVKFKAIYKNQIYMFCSSEFMDDFFYYPETYMRSQPFRLPPPRISVLGAIGCLGSRYAKQIATELGTCYLSFDQMFRKYILGGTNHPIGVLYEPGCYDDTHTVISDLVNTSDTDKSKMKILRAYVNCKEDSNIINPPYIFHNLLKPFWDQYPYNTQGFCYYRFPHTMTDFQCLIKKHYTLDAIIFIQSPDNVVFNMVDQVKMNWQLHRAVIKKTLYEQDVREMMTYTKYLKDLFKWNLQNMENAQVENGLQPKRQLLTETNKIPPGISSLIKTFDLKLEQIRDPSLICKALVKAREQQSWYTFNPQSKIIDFTQPLEPTEDLLRVYASEIKEINQMKALAKENNILWLDQNVNDFKIYSVIKKIQLLMCLRFAAVNRTQSVSPERAQMLLDSGIFFLSNFGHQCPVQLTESDVPIKRLQKKYESICPVIYRSYIYFLSSKEAEEKFCKNPEFYMKRNLFTCLIPVQCAIIGPPKSGKTTLANRLAKEFSLQIIDIKGALDYVLTELHFTKTARKIHEHLQKEKLLTDEFAILAIEAALLSPRSMTQGWILDGFPHTKDQFQKLHEKGIIPMKVFSLETTLEKCLNNIDEEDLSSICMDSDHLETIFKAYLNSREPDFVDAINNFWGNHCTISTISLSYFAYQELEKLLFQSAKDYDKYLRSVRKGKPTSLANVPVTQAEISDYLNPFFGMLCPACLNYEDLRSFPDANFPFHFIRKQIIQFKHYCYWICPKHFDTAMSEPAFCFKEDIVVERQTCKRICLNVDGLEQFFDALEYHGFCIVCYHKGMPFRVLNKGAKENIVDYKNNFYSLCSDQCLQKFTTKPNFYAKINIEEWEFTPPQLSNSFKVKDLSISLSEQLYLDQNVMPAVKQALPCLVHNIPYIPGLSSQQAGCAFLGYSLKCFSQNTAQRDMFRSSFHKLLQDLYNLKTVIDTVKKMSNPFHKKKDIYGKQIFCETDEDKNTYLKGLIVLLNNKKNAFIGLISQVLYFSKIIITKETGHEYATKWFILLNKIPNMFTEFLQSVEKVINSFSQKELGNITVEVRNEYLRSLFCTGLLSNVHEDYAKLGNHLKDLKNLLTLEEKETILLRLNPFLNFIKDIKKQSESTLILTEPCNELHCKISEFSSNSKINIKIKEDKLSSYKFKERECEIFNDKDMKKYIDNLQFSRIHYYYDPYTQIHKAEPCCSKYFAKYLDHVVFPKKKMQPVEHTFYRSDDFINKKLQTTTNFEIPLKKFQKMYCKYYKNRVKLLMKNYVRNLSQERDVALLDLEHENNIDTLNSKLQSVVGNENEIHLRLLKKLKIKEPITKVKYHDKAPRKKAVCSEEKAKYYVPKASSFFKELVTNYNFDTVVKVIQARFPNTTRQQILKSITDVFPGFLLPSSKLSDPIIIREPKQITIKPEKSEYSSSASETRQTYPWPGFNHSVTSDILKKLSISKRRIRYSKQMKDCEKI